MCQGATNSTYQSGPPGAGSLGSVTSHVGTVPGHKLPQVVAPTPTQRGFMPVNSGVVQRPGMGPMQPPSPTQQAPVQPAITPAAPPPTIQTVDTSNVPGNLIFFFLSPSVRFCIKQGAYVCMYVCVCVCVCMHV